MYNINKPIAFHPVDIAITRIHEGKVQVLLAQKIKDTEGTNVYRFPGGFVDVWDSCAEESALRESIEETAMIFTDSNLGFNEHFAKKKPLVNKLSELIKTNANEKDISSIIKRIQEIVIPEHCLTWLRKNVHYIGSTKIDDARYRDTDHKVITSFYELNPISGEAGEGPFDDIARTKWFNLYEITEEVMNPAHKPLFKMLFEKYGFDPEKEAALNRMLNRLKKQPNYELQAELGKLLMKHIDDLTPQERIRYDELKTILHNQK